MSCVSEEGLILSSAFRKDSKKLDLLTRDWDTWAPLLFLGRDRDMVGEVEQKLVREIKELYWPEGDMGKDVQQDLTKISEIYGMTYFFHPFDTNSKLLASSGLTVFTLMLTQPAAMSLCTIFSATMTNLVMLFMKYNVGVIPWPKPLGLGHTDDLNYIFPMAPYGFPPTVVTPAQKKTRRILLDTIESFSLSGSPAPVGEERVDWTPLDPSLGQYMKVGERVGMDRDSKLHDWLTLWRDIKERAAMAVKELVRTPPPTFYSKVASERDRRLAYC